MFGWRPGDVPADNVGLVTSIPGLLGSAAVALLEIMKKPTDNQEASDTKGYH